MQICEVCGNKYARSLEITLDERTHHFDCFECAIHALAPSCHHCGVKIVGHGVEASGIIYCCAHCSRAEGVASIRDHGIDHRLLNA